MLLALFYPLTIATIAAGFLAFIMLVLKLDLLLISTVVLWFYFVCTASIYLISEKALKALKMRRLFSGFITTMGIFAILSAAILILRQLSHP